MSEQRSTKSTTFHEEEIDTDNAPSSPYWAQELTRDETKALLVSRQTDVHTIKLPPTFSADGNTEIGNNTTQSFPLYQCARNRKTSDSGSDSAEEESNPVGFVEVQAVSGQPNRPTNVAPRCKEGLREMSRREAIGRNITDNFEYTAAVAASGYQHDNKIKPIYEENIDTRMKGVYDFDFIMATFFANEWPHPDPSAEKMARAHFISKGTYAIMKNGKLAYVKDMVECLRCGETMHSFEPGDDPINEHHKILKSMNKKCPKHSP